MPIFFIDTFDGRTATVDSSGIDLASVEEAADEAAALLPDFAREVIPDRQSHEFVAAVRNETGAVVYRAGFLFRGRFDALPVSGQTVEPLTQHIDEIERAESLRKEAIALAERVTSAINGLWGICEQAKASAEASRRGREERSQ